MHAEFGENRFGTTWDMLTITNNVVTSISKHSDESFHQCLFKLLSVKNLNPNNTYKKTLSIAHMSKPNGMRNYRQTLKCLAEVRSAGKQPLKGGIEKDITVN